MTSAGIFSGFVNKAGHLTGYASLAQDGAKVGSSSEMKQMITRKQSLSPEPHRITFSPHMIISLEIDI